MLFNIIFVTLAFRRAYSITSGEVMELVQELDQKTRMNGYSPYDTCTNTSGKGGSLCNALSFTAQIWRDAVETAAKSYVVKASRSQEKMKEVPKGMVCYLESYKAYSPELSLCEVVGQGDTLKAWGDISCLYRCVDLASVLGLDDHMDMWTKSIVKNDDFQSNPNISKVPGAPGAYTSYRCDMSSCRLATIDNSICFVTNVKARSRDYDLCYMYLQHRQGFKDMWIKGGSDFTGVCGFRCLSMDMDMLA